MRLAETLRKMRRAGVPIVVPYLMVDRNRIRKFRPIVEALREGGACALELGFPFTDPIADGPVLEAAAWRALSHGTGWRDLLRACRIASSVLPTAVMTYANPLWQEGLVSGFGELAASGASGLIVADLSLEESAPFRAAARSAGLSLVLLAAPGTPPARARALARSSRGFLYLVSRYGTTGARALDRTADLKSIVRNARAAAPNLPVLVGFGIRNRATASRAFAAGADGVVVGTALEERLAQHPSPRDLSRWIRSIVTARAVRRRS